MRTRCGRSMWLGVLVWGGAVWGEVPNAVGQAPAEDAKAVANGTNNFALDLYAKLKDQDGNLAFSPYSVSSALAMTYAGARGETAKQMATVLHFPFEGSRLHGAFANLVLPRSADEQPACVIRIANALWGQKGYGFLPEFLELTRAFYGAGLREVDFAGATEEARQTINAWVAERTEQKIKGLLSPPDMTRGTTLILTNAIYFKGLWRSQFKTEFTKNAPFHASGEKDIEVPMMQQAGTFAYADEEGWQILELPYVGDAVSMVVFLPGSPERLTELEKNFSTENLGRWLAKLQPQPVQVSLPRFKAMGKFRLAEVLKSLGMTDAFGGGRGADFSGMTGNKDLTITNVIHQAYVEVNEEGTEAAAATAVIMGRSAPVVPVFRADRPFLFVIQDKRSGVILFMGRVANPAESAGG
jgi:serine protease inhibitor